MLYTYNKGNKCELIYKQALGYDGVLFFCSVSVCVLVFAFALWRRL